MKEGLKIRRTGWKELFPYEPYPSQVEFIEDIENTVGEGGVLIAEACNGFGKTASALSCLLLYRPIVYATRTHEQVKQVLDEVSSINDHSDGEFSAVNLASRQHLCLNPECQDLPLREAQETCRSLREEDDCPYDSNIEEIPKGSPHILSKKNLRKVGKQRSICPYYLARLAAQKSRIVVVPYPYVFDERVRASVGLKLSGKALILDEGHNLDKIGQDTLSDTLSEFVIDMASRELKSIRKSPRHMIRLNNYLNEHTLERPTLQAPEELERSLELVLGTELSNIIEHYQEFVDKIRFLKLQHDDPPISYLNGVLTFLDLVSNSQKECYVAIYQKNTRGNNTLTYRCLDPSLAIEPVVKMATGVLIMSGTLSPIESFAEVLELDDAECKTYPPIQNIESVKMVIDPSVTTSYRKRTEPMILKIGLALIPEVAKIPNGVLIFFPQRNFMHMCLDAWGINRLMDTKKGMIHLGGKPLFIEGVDALSNRDIATRYKSAAIKPEGAVFCCVFRGRNAEGSNFPNEQARGIFLVGVPYANYGDPIIRAQIGYYNYRRRGLGNKWYTMDAFRAANQALGRGIRDKDDWCQYWLLDHRYVDYVDLISKWAQGKGPEIINRLDDIS